MTAKWSAETGETGVPKNLSGKVVVTPSNTKNGLSSSCLFLLNSSNDNPGVRIASGPRTVFS